MGIRNLNQGGFSAGSQIPFYDAANGVDRRGSLQELAELVAALIAENGGGGTTPIPPSITTQPSNATVTEGATATFTVVAAGDPTLAYQWQADGVAVSGATSAGYTTPTLTTADSGTVYTVTVTNDEGSVTSAGATLTVNAAVADTRPRFGYGSATAGVADPATLFASMTAFGSNGSVAGTFTTAPPPGQYAWAAFEAGVSAGGVTFSVTLGPGGWQGASEPGPIDDGGVNPNASVVTWTDPDTGVARRFFRTSFANAADTWTTS